MSRSYHPVESPARSGGADMEIVAEAPGEGPQQAQQQAGLAHLAPPLLEGDAADANHAARTAAAGSFLPRNKWARCGLELLVLLGAIVVAFLVGRSSAGSDDPNPVPVHKPAPVIVMSFDGFRRDYIDLTGEARTPNFHALRRKRNTVMAGGLLSQFPSLTFPNHYTLVTGMYPEAHGIVANHIFDPDTGKSFHYTKPDTTADPNWWKGEPIWNLAQRYNISAGTMFWVGSETEINGQRPNKWRPYDGSFPNEKRVQQVLEWLDSGDCQLCMVYFSAVDDAGHKYGGGAPEVLDTVEEMDRMVGAMMKGLEERGLADTASLLLVADHGMGTAEKQIYMDDYFDLRPERGLRAEQGGPILTLWLPLPIDESLVDEVMANASRIPKEQMECWRRDDTPAHFKYQNNPRIAPINCLPAPGFVTGTRAENVPGWSFPPSLKGVHGWDPAHPEMQSLFMAHSPLHLDSGVDGKAGVIDLLSNVNVYNLMCHLLHISPAPNNGTMLDFAPFLKR